MNELGSCWNCIRFTPFTKKERRKNFGCPGGCHGNGIQTPEEANTPFRECYQTKPSFYEWQTQNKLYYNDDCCKDKNAPRCRKCENVFYQNGEIFCKLILQETNTDGCVGFDNMVCERFTRKR